MFTSELKEVANALVAKGRGILAADESSGTITKRLAASGKKVTVPARLHEMRKRGHIFKPVDRAPYYKLSTRGVKWIEEEILPPLKKK